MAVGATSGSGLDVAGIVGQLMTIERQPLTKLDAKEASYQAQLTAYGAIQGAISNFQSAVQGLNSAGLYQSYRATSSDTTAVSASATSSAVAGTYSVEVTSLTQAQKLLAAGQTSDTAAIGTGTATTITFDFGTISGGALTPFDPLTNTGGTYAGAAFTSNGSTAQSITIDGTNNTLQGIRDAINKANLGVTATIVNDGSGTPFRLALAANNSGANNSMRISVAGGGDASITSLLSYNPAGAQNLSQTQVAQNANLRVNGVGISKTTNTISDVIPGVTLNLSKVTTSPVTLSVAKDSSAASSAISNFVKAYNALTSVLKQNTAYDPATKKGAVLVGDSTVRQLQMRLHSILNTPVTGTPGNLTTLSSVGITFQKDGTLAFDSTKLNNAVNNNFNDIASLFSAVGKASDSFISFNAAATGAKAGSYGVEITQLATQGSATGAAVTVPATITTGVNDSLTLSVDGTSAAITLAAGSYATVQALATELQSKINGNSALVTAGAAVTVTVGAGGNLLLTSNKYGSTSSVSIASGNALATLGLSTPTQTVGVNVAGTIGGTTAVGDGQKLTSTSGTAVGLSINVTGGTLGPRGTLTYSAGYATQLDSWASSVLGNKGTLASRTDGINSSIKDIGKRRDALNVRLTQLQAAYVKQYSRLDTMLSSMQQTQNYLSQQLASLPKM